MNSRVERYHYEETTEEVPSRVAKNQELYDDISASDFSKMKPNDNVKVIETSGNRIDLDKIKRYIENSNEEETQSKSVVVKDDIDSLPQKDIFEEEKIYDINSVLELAKEKKESYYEDEKHKKLRDTQYDILSKINLYDEKDPDEEEQEKIELNTDEQTLIDLINTVTKKKEDLLEELTKGDENTIVTSPIKEEKTNENIVTDAIKEITESKPIEEPKEEKKVEETQTMTQTNTMVKNLDKSFYTNSMSFSKEDFEGFEELEKNVKKNNNLVKLSIFILILLALATIFVILKYVLNVF